jgi:1,4-dihydroxy-2-naphthoate octaprenyltransferase
MLLLGMDGHLPYIYYLFVFCATVLIYALHRVVGYYRVRTRSDIRRFAIVGQRWKHLLLYLLFAGGGGVYCLWRMGAVFWGYCIVPAVISLGYVLPVRYQGKSVRLRDLPMVKIFLLVFTWGYVTTLLPFAALQQAPTSQAAMLFVERCLYIFALALPFDLRDTHIDATDSVPTLATRLGYTATTRFIALLLVLFSGVVLLHASYTPLQKTSLVLSAVCTYGAIRLCAHQKHDYYFSGILDGMMLLQSSMVLLVS